MDSNIQDISDSISQIQPSCPSSQKRPRSNNNDESSGQGVSQVWKYFRRENLGGEPKALCNYCDKALSGKKGHGTSHLWTHHDSCPKRDKSLTGTPSQRSRVRDYTFSQEVSRRELAQAIIMHEYPLATVEHIGFRRFISSLEPRFKIVSRGTIKRDCLKIFDYERDKTFELLHSNHSRVAITTDMWTSSQKKGFMAITAHFISDSWTLESRVISFAYVSCPHTAEVLTDVLHECLLEWKLDKKISGLTLDNCSTNDCMVGLLLSKLSSSSLMLKGSFLQMRCCAHIVNLIVKEGLDVIKDGIERIRESVLFWTATQKRLETFENTCRHLGIDCSKKLSLDCPTRWNSTYLMLLVALEYRSVFALLKYKDPNYKSLPSDEDWEFAGNICKKLKLFYNVTLLFSGNQYPTANLFFPQVCEIKLALDKWLYSGDAVIEQMASRMLTKFDKYWSQINGILGIATILDPRYKLKILEYYFPQIYIVGSGEEIERIRRHCYELFDEYNRASQVRVESSHSSHTMSFDDSEMIIEDPLTKFDAFVREENSTMNKSELDDYLGEKNLPRSADFDILAWWKNHGALKYPILHKIARDILAIPISTVASESAFSISGRLIGPHRSRLHPKTVSALMCAQSWLLAELDDAKAEKHARGDIFGDSDVEDDIVEEVSPSCQAPRPDI